MTIVTATIVKGRLSEEGLGVWTTKEHERFMEAMTLYPKGPWKVVAEYVGTRNARQTMTHAQKYRQKLERHQRGLRTKSKHSPRKNVTGRPHRVIKSTEAMWTEATYHHHSPRVESPTQPTLLSRSTTTKRWVDEIDSAQAFYMHPNLQAQFQSSNSTMAMVPLMDFEQRVASPVDTHAVWFHDCFDHLLDWFGDEHLVEV